MKTERKTGMGRVTNLILGALVVAVVASAIAVVQSTHLTRQAHGELRDLERQRDQLQVEWSRLLLERGTLASHDRIKELAVSRLQMGAPDAANLLVVKP